MTPKTRTEIRTYPQRPLLAVSAAIFRGDTILLVRRAREPDQRLYTLPGGLVETGETLSEAVVREVREETALEIKSLAFASYREIIRRDNASKVESHFLILSFAARWCAGEARLNGELDEARWIDPAEIKNLRTTEGLAEIVEAARICVTKPV